MKDFTLNSNLWSVRHCKEFKPFKKYIVCPRRFASVMQVYKIKNLQWFFPLNPQLTAETLNEMKLRIQGGQKLYYPLDKKDVAVYPFIIGQNMPFVLVLPGGGYDDVCSLVEGFTTAVWLNKCGYNAFIGQYSVGKNAHYPNPQDDVATMLKFIFANAKQMGVNPARYAVCGFSAGGHLAASWGTKILGYAKYNLPKPDMLMLAYPVITMGQNTHKGSRKNLLGKERNNIGLQDKYSIEKLIDNDYPKTFVWQCKNDNVVPIENTILLEQALKGNGVSYEYVQVEGNKHGWGLGVGSPAEGWIEKAIELWQL